MTMPPTGHHARHSPERSPVLIRLVQTSDLPDGVNALASADGGTIIVRAGLDKATRRRAVREVLAHRFPGLLVFPVLAACHLRRAVIGAAQAVARLVQSAAGLITPDSPAFVLVAGAAVVTATAAGGAVMTLTGRVPHSARTPAQASAPHRPGSTTGEPGALARHASRSSGGRPSGAPGPVPAPQPGTAPVPPPSGSPPALPIGPITSPVTSLLRSVLPSLPPVPVPVPSVSVSASLPPIPIPPVPSPSPTCIQLGPIGTCLSP
jgi:hypothetical protein